MVDETWLTSLREEADRRAAELTAAIETWSAGDPATRERWRLDRARMFAAMSAKRFKEADETRLVEERRAAARAKRLIVFAPPSLQELVEAHGTYDRITQEAWAKFNAEMAEWKAKVRAGETHGGETYDSDKMRKRG